MNDTITHEIGKNYEYGIHVSVRSIVGRAMTVYVEQGRDVDDRWERAWVTWDNNWCNSGDAESMSAICARAAAIARRLDTRAGQPATGPWEGEL